MTFYDQDIRDAARDAEDHGYDDRPTAWELRAEELYGWDADEAALRAEEYKSDQESGMFDEF